MPVARPPPSFEVGNRLRPREGGGAGEPSLGFLQRFIIACYSASMSTLSEIEAAADQLPPEQQQELLLFLGARLHPAGGHVPPPRDIPLEQIQAWIAEDEAGYRRFQRDA